MYKSLVNMVTRLAPAKYTSNGDLYFEYFFLVPCLKSRTAVNAFVATEWFHGLLPAIFVSGNSNVIISSVQIEALRVISQNLFNSLGPGGVGHGPRD